MTQTVAEWVELVGYANPELTDEQLDMIGQAALFAGVSPECGANCTCHLANTATLFCVDCVDDHDAL